MILCRPLKVPPPGLHSVQQWVQLQTHKSQTSTASVVRQARTVNSFISVIRIRTIRDRDTKQIGDGSCRLMDKNYYALARVPDSGHWHYSIILISNNMIRIDPRRDVMFSIFYIISNHGCKRTIVYFQQP